MAWTVDLFDIAGNSVAAEVPYAGLRVKRVLDSPGSVEIDLPWDASYSDWAGGNSRALRQVTVSSDGDPWWGGYLWRVRGSGRSREAAVQGEGYYSVLRRRFVHADLVYAAVAEHQIAWNLIASAQGQTNGSHGFIQGAHVGSSRTRDRTYCANEVPNVAEAIEELAGLQNGFSFEIDALKAFNTWDGSRGTATAIVFSGSDEYDLDWEDDASEALSYASVASTAKCEPPVVTAYDSGAATSFGRLEATTETETDDETDMAEQAEGELAPRKSSLFEATISFDESYGPAWGDYDLGDTVRIEVDDHWATFERDVRITEIGVTAESPDVATVELTVVPV